MSEHYRYRLRQLQKLLEPGLRRMLLLSFLLHLVIPVILSGVLKITHKSPPPLPVYRVNLVNKPVEKPRAGRPDAAPVETKKAPDPQPEAKLIPAKKSEPEPPKKTVTPKAVPKQAPPAKPVKPKVQPDKAAESTLQKRLAEMQAEAERNKAFEALKASIAAQKAALGKKDVQAPVGEPDGTGTEAGVSSTRYIEAFITEQWRLSPYQSPLNLEAVIKVYYSKEGKQGLWKMEKKSGNAFFDDTVKNAIIKSRDLGQTLPAAGEFEIVFNLKDLQNK